MADETTNTGTDAGTTATTTATTGTDAGKAPTFAGEFDPDRAARLIENLRADLAKAQAKAQAFEDAGKSELEKAQARTATAEQALAKSLLDTAKVTAAKAHNIPDKLIKLISGATADEIEANARLLGEVFGTREVTADTDTTTTRPKAQLIPGQGGTTAVPFDAAAVAKLARQR